MMIKKYYKFIEKQVHETFRDITSLGSLTLLAALIIFFLFIDSKISFVILIGIIAVEVIGAFIKLVFHKKRPNKQKFTNIVEKIDAGSFPSIHSARVMLTALSIYPIFSSLLALILLAVLILLVGVSRIVLNKHYIVDVIAGYALGVVCWYLSSLIL